MRHQVRTRHSEPMATLVRPLTVDDAATVLDINETNVNHLAPMDEDEFRWFVEEATLAWGVEVDAALVGFVLVLEPGLAYPSRNYAWFSERYDDFLYLDRVAIDERARRQGVGTVVYDEVERRAADRGVPLLLEVNLEPRNDPSLAFHAGRGFEEVGTLEHDGGAKVVRLLAKAP